MSPKKIIRLSKSCIGDAEKNAVLSVLNREFLGMGSDVQKFELELTNFFGRPAVCVVNGTAALQLALQGCGIGAGDEVLVQSLTYVASFQAISALGAKPIACEINPETLTLDISDAERRITPNTKAVMPVLYGGGVGSLDRIYAFAQKYKLRVIEDAAHAFGTRHEGSYVGGSGDIACFSFDGIKNITSGEGGCIVTEDKAVLQLVRDARLLGVERDTEKRYKGSRSWEFDVGAQGWRYHMSNIMAAIGIEQLKRLDEFSTIRRNRAKLYDQLFENNSKIIPLPHNYENVNPHIYVVKIETMHDRNLVQKKMLDAGIQTGVHYQPNHLLKYYQDKKSTALPITEQVYSKILTLPMHPDLSEEDVNYIASQLIAAL